MERRTEEPIQAHELFGDPGQQEEPVVEVRLPPLLIRSDGRVTDIVSPVVNGEESILMPTKYLKPRNRHLDELPLYEVDEPRKLNRRGGGAGR